MEIDKSLYNEIKAYCEINGLNTREYIHRLLKKAFMVDKYGEVPMIFNKKEPEPIIEEKIEKIVVSEEKNIENFEKEDEWVNDNEENGVVKKKRKRKLN